MLHFLHAADLARRRLLAAAMFRHRALRLRDCLGWPVRVDAQGRERDECDDEGPLCVVWEDAGGGHGGSARFLPTTGRTMTADHFLHLTGGAAVRSPLIWEVTRFCLAPGARARVALMLGGGAMMARFTLAQLIGVYDRPMERLYRRRGAAPEVMGRHGGGPVAGDVTGAHADRASGHEDLCLTA